MTQSQPLRLQAKRANRVAGWLLAVPVGFLWLLVIVLASLGFAAFLRFSVADPMNFFALVVLALVTCLLCLLALLLTGKGHEALAVYEFTSQV
ncbi:MAG: hypothetical protein LKKZDAJK_000264 [Candidatus Fervidibacter sp.]